MQSLLALTMALASLPAAPLRDSLPLDAWRFQPGHPGQPAAAADWVPVRLPYLWTQTWTRPKEADRTAWAEADLRDLNSGWYETGITVPEAWRGRRLLLDLVGVECDAAVYVDGVRVAELPGPDGRVDLTAVLAPGRGVTLRLWVTRWWEDVARQRAQDPMRDLTLKRTAGNKWYEDEEAVRRGIPGGLAEPVALLAVPADAEITDVVVRPSVRARELRLLLDCRLAQPLPGGQWQVCVAELDGRTAGLPSATLPVQAEGGTQTMALPWPDPHLWELDAGYLYRLEVRLLDAAGRPLDEYPPLRFGFREVWTEGRQLMLNGHPARLRLGYFTGSVNQMHLFEGMGFNAMEFQPNPTAWYGPWGVFPGKGMQSGSRELLDAADEHGWAVLMPVPGVSHVRDALLKPEVEAAYRRDVRAWLRRLDRVNRPSILMWTPSMNTQGHPGPEGIGRQPTTKPPAWFGKTDAVLHEIDPTRLVFHHQGGQTGDVETANLYLNFVPLAEQEDWFSAWAAHGEKPWIGVEHLSPVSLDFFKQGEAWFTEYAAIYLGDRAYALEKDEYLRACERAKAKAKDDDPFALCGAFSANGDVEQVGEWTAYYELCDLFFRGVNRAWRGYGVNGGWFPWLFDVGFGIPPGYQPRFNHWYIYEDLQGTREQLRQRPAWANPLYDSYRDTMQPLLVYLGGRLPQFTAVEPRYTAGETAERSLVAVWDGPGSRRLTAAWALEVAGKAVQSGELNLELGPGAIDKRAIRLRVPVVTARIAAKLTLTVTDAGGVRVAADTRNLTFFPVVPAARSTTRWGLYDPAGLADDFLQTGVAARPVGHDEELGDLDVLLIGPRALSSGDLPFDASDVKRGLRVLILEQELPGLERFGFRCQDVVPRRVFPRVKGHPVLAGLASDDFAHWRGAGKLLPSTSEGMRLWPWPHGRHWGNRGSVASVIIETPQALGFTPLLVCEFDLGYTPLLWLRYGKGEVLWSQLDLMGRIGAEPAATQVAANLVRYLDGSGPPEQSKAADWGEGAEPQRPAEGDARGPVAVLLVPDGRREADCSAFVERGGTAVCGPRTPVELRAMSLPWDLPLMERDTARVTPDRLGDEPLLAGVGPELVHWRRVWKGYAFAEAGLPPGAVRLLDGWLLRVPYGKGQFVFCQCLPGWQSLNSGDSFRVKANYHRLTTQIATNLGVAMATDDARQLLSRRPFAPMVSVRLWQVRGKEGAPWRLRGEDAKGQLDLPDGAQAVTWLYSSVAREATVRGGAVAATQTVRLNAVALSDRARRPCGAKAPLRAGWNRLTAHQSGGPDRLHVELSDPGDLRVAPTPERPDWVPPASSVPKRLKAEPLPATPLYLAPSRPDADPYGFTAW